MGIRRILSTYYTIFHKLRYVLFLASLVGTGLSIYYAAKLELPTNSEVRLLNEKVEYEQTFMGRMELLSPTLEKESGSPGCSLVLVYFVEYTSWYFLLFFFFFFLKKKKKKKKKK